MALSHHEQITSHKNIPIAQSLGGTRCQLISMPVFFSLTLVTTVILEVLESPLTVAQDPLTE